MKRIKLLFVFAFALCTSTMAQQTTNVHVTSYGSEKIYVLMSSMIETPIDVKIYTEKGELAYSCNSKYKVKEYKKLFNLRNLKNGYYLVKVLVGNATYENQMLKTKGKMKLVERKVSFEPHFSFANNVVRLAYQNAEEEHVKVSIKKDGSVYHESELGNRPVLVAKYNLKELEKGVYEVSLSCNNQYYQYLVER